ncbi:MAG: hypothetical protein DRH15_02820, partial [Deltaproteobacteria bacterium]
VGDDGNRPREEATDVLIGADGAFSRVARDAGIPRPRMVHLLQAVVRLPKDMDPGVTRIWFLPQDTPYFYWLIPHSPSYGVLGLIHTEEKEGQSRLERFLHKKNISAFDYQGAPIPLYEKNVPMRREIADGHVYLVGDAAGHVKVTTVGGVVTGLRGARAVARAIEKGRFDRELIRLRRELSLHRLIRKILHGFRQSDYVKLLDLLNPPARHLLGAITRDEADKLLMRIMIKQPRLFLVGLRFLLTGGA